MAYVDITSILSQLMPVISVVLVTFIMITLFKELRGVF